MVSYLFLGVIDMKYEKFTARDGKEINLAVWEEVAEPKGLVQIIHGMCEHVARYDEFAEYLNSKGYLVDGDDHRGHGLTDKDNLGIALDGDLFKDTLRDELDLTDYLINKYSLPVYVFGHSYGSFITQNYLMCSSDKIAGAILCGSALMSKPIASFGYRVARKKCKKQKNNEGTFFADVTFNSYDKKLKEGKNAWLSYNKQNVEAFNNDELCGFTCSYGFYRDFFKGLVGIAKGKWEISNKNLPILIIAGADDPVGGSGKLVKKLYKRYKKNGNKATLMLVSNGRHEILNEYNKAETFAFIHNFITNCDL